MSVRKGMRVFLRGDWYLVKQAFDLRFDVSAEQRDGLVADGFLVRVR